jgi:hypothetical protein
MNDLWSVHGEIGPGWSASLTSGIYRAAELRCVKDKRFRFVGDIPGKKKAIAWCDGFPGGMRIAAPYYLKRDGIAAPVENL